MPGKSAPAGKRLSRWMKKIGAGGEGWQPRGAPFPRLVGLDTVQAELGGIAGIYAIWHLGVRPQWLRVRASRDLAASIAAAKSARPILAFQPNGGLFLAWMTAPPERSAGMVAYLARELRPVVQGPTFNGDIALKNAVPPIRCGLPPGTGQPPETPSR